MNRPLLVSVLLAAWFAGGCTTTFTNLTPTRALDPWDAQVSVQTQISAHGNVVSQTIEGGKVARDIILDEDSSEPISEAEFREFLDAGLVWYLFRPGASFELMGRIGLWDVLEGMDLGVRYDFNVLKGDLKLQFWESEDHRWAASALAGVGKHFSVAPGFVEWLTLTEWSRTDFDFQGSVGFEYPDIVKAYVNPRVLISRTSVGHKLPDFVLDRIPPEIRDLDPSQLFKSETMVYYGVTMGGMVGYKYVFLAVELTMMRLHFKPTVLEQERDYGGVLLAPAAGLVVTW